jgi:hypothetical protein
MNHEPVYVIHYIINFQRGRYPLTLDSYNQIFANFLIGKTPYGPGRFIFGCFEHTAQRTEFQLIHGPGEDVLGI